MRNALHNTGVVRYVALDLLKRMPTEISIRKKRIWTATISVYVSAFCTIRLDRTRYGRG